MKKRQFKVPYFIFSFILSFVNVTGVILIPALVGHVIDAIYNELAFKNLFFLILIIILLNTLTNYFSQLFMKKYVIYSMDNLREKLLNKMTYAQISEIDYESSGRIANKIINDINNIKEGKQQFLLTFIPGFLTIFFTLTIIYFINLKIFLYVLLSTPIIIIASLILARISRKYFKIQQTSMNKLTSKTKETINLMKYIHAERIEGYKEEELNKLSKEHTKASRTAIFFSSLANPTSRFLNGVVVIIVLILGIELINEEVITVGILSTLILLTTNYSKPINEITSTLTIILTSVSSYKNIYSLLKAKIEPEKEEIIKLKGNIRFENVSFKYKDKMILKNINFEINEGERVAIIGETGSGKTTILNLLLEFYTNYEGKILVDNVNLKNLNTKEFRNQIGVILQNLWMNSTNPVEVINYKKRKIETYKYKSINNLSDGQKQLLALERLDYKQKKIIFLDEATSDIDPLTEKELSKKIDDISRDKTTIIIAHKLKTIETADKIIVIKNGEVCEIGTHKELLKNKSEYFDIYS